MNVTRRAAIAIAAVAIAAWILRPQLAAALVLRGDEQLYRARPADALRYYERALRLDPNDGVAVDRFLFVALTLRRPESIDTGIRLAGSYLRSRDDDTVRLDRAMAYRARGSLERALGDFTLVGTRDQDVTALTFAGFIAARLGRREAALELWRQALKVSPHWFPANHALARAGALR